MACRFGSCHACTVSFSSLPPTRPPTSDEDDGSLNSPLGRAATAMLVYLVVLWLVDFVNAGTSRRLFEEGGIRARDVGSLPDIITAPFLHANIDHLTGNATALFSLGIIAALPGIRRFLMVTGVIIVVSGLGVWLFSPSRFVTAGASGVIFGYLGYLMVRGLIDRRPVDLVVTAGVAIAYGYWVWDAVNPAPNVSWQGHLSGFLGGILAAWIFRRRRPKPAAEPPSPTFGTGLGPTLSP